MPEDKTDEELLALMAAEGAAQEASATPPEAVQPAPSNAAPIISFFKKLTGADMLCVFGDTGSGKSKLVCEIALAEQRAGGRVVYFDTEGGFQTKVVEMMKLSGIDYRRVSIIREIYQSIRNLNATLVVVDSTTLGITGRWFAEQLDSRGRLLQEVQYLYYMLKDWCHKHNAMVVVVAQPVSEFGGRTLDPMGDKANFYLKDTLYIDYEKDGFTIKKRVLRVFKSRSLMDGTTLCDLTTSATGMTFGPLNQDAVNTMEG